MAAAPEKKKKKTPAAKRGGCFTYILRCADGSLYTGWTNDLAHRLAAHNAGTGAKYTRGRGPVELVYCEEFDTREEAMHREAEIKKMPRGKKEELLTNPD